MSWLCKGLSKDENDRLPSDSHVTKVTPMDEVERRNNYKLWIPGAENVYETENLKMRTRGEYTHGYPEGSVIHYTSGWGLDKNFLWKPYPMKNNPVEIGFFEKMARRKALDVMFLGVKNGYNYLVMDILGNLYQSRPLDKHGYHAGKSFAKGIGHSVSSKLVGIEVVCPGKVNFSHEKSGLRIYKTWYGQEFSEHYVRQENGEFYVMFTKEQEEKLVELHAELLINSPILEGGGGEVFRIANIYGHDGVSPGRKSDPGGSMAVSIDTFRGRVLAAALELTKLPGGEIC